MACELLCLKLKRGPSRADEKPDGLHDHITEQVGRSHSAQKKKRPEVSRAVWGDELDNGT
jgi:hypothetical protein